MIDTLVTDLIETTRGGIERAGVVSVRDVRQAGRPLAGLSPGVREANARLKVYLHANLYQHPRIERMRDKSRLMLEKLFERFRANPKLLPREFRDRVGDAGLDRVIADYVAGMTDRYAIQEYQRLFDPSVRA
jgi:dGTPase